MKKLKQWITCITALAAMLASGVALSHPITVVYDQTSDKPQLTSLDIWTHEAGAGANGQLENAPVIVFFHGGSWKFGDKYDSIHEHYRFCETYGCLLVSSNYRVAPDHTFPTIAQDAANAVAWVKANIEQYGGDPEQIYVMGHSAGGHVAALISTDETYMKNAGLSLNDMAGSILVEETNYDLGAYVVTSPRGEEAGRENARAVFGGDSQEILDRYSPVEHASSSVVKPEMLIMHIGGGGRSEVHANRLAEALAKGGHSYTMGVFPEKNHQSLSQDIGREPAEGLEELQTEAVREFIFGPKPE